MMNANANFGDLPKNYTNIDRARIAVVPVPYDGTSTWGKGADKGPAAIIEASAHMELYNIETDSEVYLDCIFTDKPVTENTSPELMVDAVKQQVRSHIIEDRFVVTLGGEHSVSIGAIQAHEKYYNKLTVLQLDAHADLRNKYEGSRFNHACVMARAQDLCPIVQVGIRSMDTDEKQRMQNSTVFFAHDIQTQPDWIDDVIENLTENVYITIDLDVFDISIMPATGTPEPGGLLWYQVLALLKQITRVKNVVGFDVVELCPNAQSQPYDFLAAKLIYTLLSYKFKGNSHE